LACARLPAYRPTSLLVLPFLLPAWPLQQAWQRLFLLALQWFFWLLPSSSLLKRTRGKVRNLSHAYIGSVLQNVQVFFKTFSLLKPAKWALSHTTTHENEKTLTSGEKKPRKLILCAVLAD